jgi:demethylspheroidene O-methyltransferase
LPEVRQGASVRVHRPDLGAPQRPGWGDRWRQWRDRLLASGRFQRGAAAFALTRPFARRDARALFDLVAGFVYSQVLLACVRLKLFEVLAESPQTLERLSTRLDLPMESTRRLMSAAVALRLAEHRSGGRYGLGRLGAPMVGNAAVSAMVEHHAALYADLADPVALLREGPSAARGGALAGYWPYANAQSPDQLPDERVSTYSALMSASQPLVADEILDAYPMHGHRCLLDIGGGDGTFLAAVARRHPGLQLQLFDLPAVAALATKRFASEGIADRATAHGGSFLGDPLPQGADVATLVRVIHDHDDGSALRILHAARKALPPGGTLLLAEPMAETPGAEPMGDAYFGFYLLAMGRGRPRSARELTRMLQAAGFESVRLLPTRMPLQTRLLVARCATPAG